ncbi:hypothetical protein [Microbacterium sp.]|uniref:hypothetical protein n=1 Tax=Microbacterium sp. TaxID=51671 RepID=UPI0026030247|nr:hypothetical protein [Microbacterium sp.]MCV0334553.1 hypothetical protein [Microbacterium sp.]MCV0376261.1 hypothetical protein [Microbacterium sp.]MCV0389820.1 hypothetical protein [Microbacterium sp.]MCV0419355.1 hypothetical protein [Microbacterium sp.]MCV0421660.1 hypothetical protein [Microbacterium sp.]
MSAKESRPDVTEAASENRFDGSSAAAHLLTGGGHSFLARYLSQFADARRALRGQLVCVRFAGSALDAGLCDVTGRVKATDRTGLVLVVPGHAVLDGSEVVSMVPWCSIERVVAGWADDVFPEEVAS